MANSSKPRSIKNPWPRFCLAAALTVWGGSNLFSAIFLRREIGAPDDHNLVVGMVFAILVSLLPLVVAIVLVWTILVGQDTSRNNQTRQAGKSKSSSRSDHRSKKR